MDIGDIWLAGMVLGDDDLDLVGLMRMRLSIFIASVKYPENDWFSPLHASSAFNSTSRLRAALKQGLECNIIPSTLSCEGSEFNGVISG